MNIYKEIENNDQCEDSNFQDEGNYYIKEMPKYKYEIKVFHLSPNREKRSKTPDKIISSARFTILNKLKKNNRNLAKSNKNNENNNELYKNKSPRNETIRFFTGKEIIERDIRKTSYEKLFDKKRYYQKDLNYKDRYNNIINNSKNNIINDFNCYHDYRNGYNYIINIYPNKSCICEREINKTIKDYYEIDNMAIKNKYNFDNGNECDLCKRKNMNIYDENIRKINNIYNYSNLYTPQRKINYRKPIKIEQYKNLYYPLNEVNTSNFKNPENDFYYNNYDNFNNNIYYNLTPNRRINRKNYNKDIYIRANTKNLKKIKLPTKNNIISNNIYKSPFSSKTPDKIINKNLAPINTSFITRKRNNKINNNKYKNKNNNLDNPEKSLGSKTNQNIIINKSSEKYEKIKVVPLDKKINPLIIKKSVQKPIKEKILNKDGTTTNVIKQTSIITSIETKPLRNNDNSKKENLVKEKITKIYTTLTKNETQNENDNNNFNNNEINSNNDKSIKNFIIKDKNNNKEEKLDKILNEINLNIKDNENKEKENKDIENNSIGSISNNLNIDDINKEKNKNININNICNKEESKNLSKNNDLMGTNTDLLIQKNSTSSFNYSSLYSNLYEPSEQYNMTRINEQIKYIKYLYYRYANLTSPGTKEETLNNYFIKLSDEDKKEILNNLNDGNDENIKIYNKLKSILENKNIAKNKDNIKNEVNDNENEKDYKNKKSNILFKKKKVAK